MYYRFALVLLNCRVGFDEVGCMDSETAFNSADLVVVERDLVGPGVVSGVGVGVGVGNSLEMVSRVGSI